MQFKRSLVRAVAAMAGFTAFGAYAQSTASNNETVSQRNTMGQLGATPTTGVVVGTNVSFSYILQTAGAPAPTSESVQFFDGNRQEIPRNS